MTIDDVVLSTGSVDLMESRDLPTSISCGFGTMDSSGQHAVGVKVTVDGSSSENSRVYQSFAAGASFVPLIIVLFIAATTHMASFCFELQVCEVLCFCGSDNFIVFNLHRLN